MERVRKTFFDPLATSKAKIREILEGLPVGSAHAYSPEQILLCRTEAGIDEIDISSYPEDYFFNAVDLGEMGEILLRRMAGFESHLKVFEDFQIVQAPASTFKVPIVSGEIAILAVSELTPTYYDFCFADASCNACCWLARDTFPGITHSGDILNGNDLLDYIRINKDNLTEKEICVFISGYQVTQITRFLGTHPALLVANHVDKVLNIIPVPLDAATIGDATICCPLVIKRDGDSFICSILPTATTDREMMCHSNELKSPAFPEAIKRADFTISASPTIVQAPQKDSSIESKGFNPEVLSKILAHENAVLTSSTNALPPLLGLEKTQVIRFGTGIDFDLSEDNQVSATQPSSVVLPCIFGSQLEGPLILATGTVPSNTPFQDETTLRSYYEKLKNLVVVVNDRMTDNARNLAPRYRINALFIVQLTPQDQPKGTDDVLSLLNSANINAVTALAGPQSLIVIQIFENYYFYRGIADQKYLNTSRLAFGSDITSILESVGTESIVDPRVKRLVNLDEANTIILPSTGQFVQPQDLKKFFEELNVDQVQSLEEDISAAVPQIQMLLNQKDLKELSSTLVSALSEKISKTTAPLRKAYIAFLKHEYKITEPDSVKKKNAMLGELRKTTKEMQKALEPVISSLANMMSSQTTSKRTHDLKRLVRQAQIQGNVQAAKEMTFETLAGYLETYATDMGVMLLNIETMPYRELLGNLKNPAIDASPCCDLDSRVLYLDGFDAGIILEQSQVNHDGPLRSENGSSQPILALPYLSQERGSGSMVAWVCWDEFVDLESPYTVRWVDKCNEAHIAALRILMRSTLSRAIASREYNFKPDSPEIGHLMSALLMAAMSKLTAMRTTAPVVVEKADNTVTRLMRGLFGNLLTIAGSGLRPLSMVWQLFGANAHYEIPTTDAEWVWYQTVVTLYPYTGWPLDQFYENLEKLLDKAVVRVVTKNEDVNEIRQNRANDMIKYCKLRNIQLVHSRTIITILMRMLTTQDADVTGIATRLLEQLPHNLTKQSASYTEIIRYLKHLAGGGQRRTNDDIIVASVYTKRSAAFRDIKLQISKANTNKDWAVMKELCQELLDKHAELATLWQISPKSFKIQNMQAYKDLLAANFGDDVSEEVKAANLRLTKQVLADAEKNRVAWQVGKQGQYGDDFEPLDEALLDEVLTGDKVAKAIVIQDSQQAQATSTAIVEQRNLEDEFLNFKSSVHASFITTMQKALSGEDVCSIMNVSVTAMRVFIQALNPEFAWENLGHNFKVVVLELLQNRSGRAESRPVKKLLDLGHRKMKWQIEG